ncbi:hypothetical protein [Ammoniphilus sp. 3BR4]|uniref:hypothetical protein n=1 Tax=Ammoniphilus sp. 3BR4 TaxID=3158265 RepID=UPI0034659920
MYAAKKSGAHVSNVLKYQVLTPGFSRSKEGTAYTAWCAFTLDWGTSASEELQKVLPETSIVGAFKNTFFKVFNEPLHKGLKSDVYLTSADEKAKSIVNDLLESISFRLIDGGELKNNRTIERMTLSEREVSMRYGNYPHVSFRMWGLEKE